MSRELVGYVGVDAGLMWVGDPCYVIGKVGDSEEEREKVESWNKHWFGREGSFCDLLEATDAKREGKEHGNVYRFPMCLTSAQDMLEATSQAHCTGIAVSSGWGDGVYPVYVEYEGRRVKSVTVEFMEDDEDEDDEYSRNAYADDDEDGGWCFECDNPMHECTCGEEDAL